MLSKSNDTISSKPFNSPSFYKSILKYNFQSCALTLLPNRKTKKESTDTVAFKSARLWSMLLTKYNDFSSVYLFKSEMKN